MTGQRKNKERWGICPHCMYERPVRNEVMKEHRVFIKFPDVGDAFMAHCAGSGKPPMPPWRSIDTRNMFKEVKSNGGS